MANFFRNSEDELKNRIVNHEFDQIPGAWNKMSKLLDKQSTGFLSSSNLLWMVPSITAVILSSIIIYGYQSKTEPQNPIETPIAEVLSTQEPQLKHDSNNPHLENQQSLSGESLVSGSVPDFNNSEASGTYDLPKNEVLAPKKSTLSNIEITKNSNQIEFESFTQEDNDLNGSNSSASSMISANSDNNEWLNPDNSRVENNDQRASIDINISKITNNTDSEISGNTIIENNDYQNVKENITSVERENLASIVSNNATPNSTNSANIATENISSSNTTLVSKDIKTFQYETSDIKSLSINEDKSNAFKTESLPFSINKKKLRLPIQFISSIGLSTKALGGFDRLSFSPNASIAVSKRLHRMHSIELGIAYNAISNFTDQANNSELNQMSYYQLNDTYNSYSLKRVDMLELPLRYNFHLNKHLAFNAGLKYTYLINVESVNSSFSADRIGLDRHDIGLMMGVEVSINKHWSILLNYNYGLFNLSQSATDRFNDMNISDQIAGVDLVKKHSLLLGDNEIYNHVETQNNTHALIRLPENLRNSDLNLSIRYKF